MKRLILILFTIQILLVSCHRDPVSDFTASATEVGIGESIIFTNRSLDGINFEWDFGDGYTSTNYNVTHSYAEAGIYTVQLKAFGKDGVSISSMSVKVLQTYLEITVEEYYEPYYLVPDVSVRVYPTIQDWENETNLFAEGNTDSNGVIVFEGLYPQRYYIDVYGPNHDNYQLAEEDAGFIETQVLRPGYFNKFTALVDYYPPGMRKTNDTKILKQTKKSSTIVSDPRNAKERLPKK
jgi:PKD repeat protein